MKAKTGLLLINLGTPEATSFWPMRRYLKEFLSDKRVVEAKGIIWWLVLNGIILTKRPKKSGRAYSLIWNNELDESPLKTVTRSQAMGVAKQYESNAGVVVDWAMRYGAPSIADRIARLKDAGCDRILLFPLYPQYSGATTATAMDKAFDALGKMRWQPAIRTVPPYYDHKAYIDALTHSVRSHQKTLSWTPDVLIASFHGLPKAFIDKGDPYQGHCEKTVELLRDSLGMGQEEMLLAYQSRSGRAVWLCPHLEETLAKQARKGVKNLCVIAPGFASDCVETLEEIEIRAAKVFLKNGGENFSFVPCLNDSEWSIDMMVQIADEQLQGWV